MEKTEPGGNDENTAKGRLVETFRRWDTNGDGVISKAELKGLLTGLGIPEPNVSVLLEASTGCIDESDMVNYQVFVNWLYSCTARYGGSENQHCNSNFKSNLSEDIKTQDGVLSIKEIARAIACHLSASDGEPSFFFSLLLSEVMKELNEDPVEEQPVNGSNARSLQHLSTFFDAEETKKFLQQAINFFQSGGNANWGSGTAALAQTQSGTRMSESVQEISRMSNGSVDDDDGEGSESCQPQSIFGQGRQSGRQPPANETEDMLDMPVAPFVEGERRLALVDHDWHALMESMPVQVEELHDFLLMLENGGVDTSLFGVGMAKSLEELFWEVYEEHECALITGEDGKIKRVVTLVQIKLAAQDMFGNWRWLVSTMQFLHDGRQRHRKDLLARKITVDLETAEVAICRAFSERLNMPEALQQMHLMIDKVGQPTEKESVSQGYPGLLTIYRIHEVNVVIKDPAHIDLALFGLPEGRDFATMEGVLGEKNIGSHLRMWTWETGDAPTWKVNQHSLGAAQEERKRSPTPAALEPSPESLLSLQNLGPNTQLRQLLSGTQTDWAGVESMANRIRDPAYSLRAFHDDAVASFPELRLYLCTDVTTSGRSGDDEYQRTMGAMYAVYWMMRIDLDGKEGFTYGVDTEWQVRMPPDSDKDYLDDQQRKRMNFYKKNNWSVFSELLTDAGLLPREGAGVTERSACVERVIAMLALTAIHDIMKIEHLLPRVQEEHAPYNGYQEGDQINDHDVALGYVLDKFPELLPSFAGLKPAQRKTVEFTQSKLEYNQGWLVQAEAPPGALFRTFRQILVSGGLSAADVSFYFVHWFTDLAGAEPYPMEGSEKFVLKFPHPVLQQFLRACPLVQRLAHKTETEVLEEYLRTRWDEHEPPLGINLAPGEEAIAMMRVLCMAQGNAKKCLEAWEELSAADRALLGREMSITGCGRHQKYRIGEDCDDPPAGGETSMGLNRVTQQALTVNLVQTASCSLTSGANALQQGKSQIGKDKKMSCLPMAMKGGPGNSHQNSRQGSRRGSRSGPVGSHRGSVTSEEGGPALLVYYAPALLQKFGDSEALQALKRIVEVYKQARHLWPLTEAYAMQHVTVRIDTIKELSDQQIREQMGDGRVFMLVKHNEREAFVESHPLPMMHTILQNGFSHHRVLSLV